MADNAQGVIKNPNPKKLWFSSTEYNGPGGASYAAWDAANPHTYGLPRLSNGQKIYIDYPGYVPPKPKPPPVKPPVKPPNTEAPPPQPFPKPVPGSPYPAGTVAGGGSWLNSPGGIGGILQGGLAASHKALPGLLSQPVTPGLFGASPYYGGAPWGMDPLDARTFIMSQLQRALRQQPGKTML